MKEQTKLIGQASEEQIAEWKQNNKQGIFAVISEYGHIGYFKNPGRNEVNCSLSQQGQPLDPLEQLASVTFLGGSEELLKDDSMAIGVMNAIKSKLDGVRATLVNL